MEVTDSRPGVPTSDIIPTSTTEEHSDGMLPEIRESKSSDAEEDEAPPKVLDALAPPVAAADDFDDISYLDKDDGSVLSQLARVSDIPFPPLRFNLPEYLNWYNEDNSCMAR